MGIFLIVLILLFLCWPMIKRWMARFMANRAEDFIRNAAGMPPRPGSRKARQQARHAANSSGSDNGGTIRKPFRLRCQFLISSHSASLTWLS